jgi:hypothetical protein
VLVWANELDAVTISAITTNHFFAYPMHFMFSLSDRLRNRLHNGQ